MSHLEIRFNPWTTSDEIVRPSKAAIVYEPLSGRAGSFTSPELQIREVIHQTAGLWVLSTVLL